MAKVFKVKRAGTLEYPVKLAEVVQNRYGVTILNRDPLPLVWALAALPISERAGEVKKANFHRERNGLVPITY